MTRCAASTGELAKSVSQLVSQSVSYCAREVETNIFAYFCVS